MPIASAVAFLLWSHGVSRLGPARAGQFAHLLPVFGAALALAVLGEVPTFPQTAGVVLVLSGIAFVERGSRAEGRAIRMKGQPSAAVSSGVPVIRR
jgi:drug/metabolite transporter (DMT)-like permease